MSPYCAASPCAGEAPELAACDSDPRNGGGGGGSGRAIGAAGTALGAAETALGASSENTVVVAENRVLNPEGVRFPDEFVRHKAIDAIGDLALAGAPLIGAYRSVRGGHKLNHAVVTALMADRSAWIYVEAPETVRRQRGHADLSTGVVAPAYGPDVS